MPLKRKSWHLQDEEGGGDVETTGFFTPQSLSQGHSRFWQVRQRSSSGHASLGELGIEDQADGEENHDDDFARDAANDFVAMPTPVQGRTSVLSHTIADLPAFPRSAYAGWIPPLPRVREPDAIRDLLKSNRPTDEWKATSFRLDDFSVYRPREQRYQAKEVDELESPRKRIRPQSHDGRSLELVSLDRLKNHSGCNEFVFDGILSCGDTRRYVQGIKFSTLVFEGYGDPDPDGVDVANRLSIQTALAEDHDIWYYLGKSSGVYQRFYTPFLWVAQLTKHFIDYLWDQELKSVTLHHFRSRFQHWILQQHPQNVIVARWLADAGFKDFRVAVHAHIGYLWKESVSIDTRELGLRNHPIWSEADPQRMSAIPDQPLIEKRTVVTPYTFQCFKDMYFGDQLESRPILDVETQRRVRRLKRSLRLTALDTPMRGTKKKTARLDQDARFLTPDSLSKSAITIDVQAGDIVCIQPVEGGKWKINATLWYAYVQSVRTQCNGDSTTAQLDVLWIYHPADTTIGSAYYLFDNELFMSDNCSCGKDAIPLSSVVGKVDVSWYSDQPSATGFFVRQRFRTVHDDDTYDFSSLKSSDFKCECDGYLSKFDKCMSMYKPGDTVLYKARDSGPRHLEPSQLVNFDIERRAVNLRKLPFAHAQSPSNPNELRLSNEVFAVSARKVVRSCDVLLLDRKDIESGNVPTPYDRGGLGDLFYLARPDDSQRDSATGIPLPKEGWIPGSPTEQKKLKGLGIFCGGGGLDRGLEEGGAIEFTHAVDWATQALHSYRACAENPDDINFFCGSVDDCLALAIAGKSHVVKGNAKIAAPGDVDVLAAGSPCPGFSRMNNDKMTEKSNQDSSKVASVISYVDFYCPQYLFLENVPAMCEGRRGVQHGVFGQIIAALVGMGYQVSQHLVDSWTHGSSQSRARVFIIAVAPGLALVPRPEPTHAHPTRCHPKSLGKSSNGLNFGIRRLKDSIYKHVSTEEAMWDLPYIGDALPLCIRFPDHRSPADLMPIHRDRIAQIPTLPHGMGICQAYAQGRLYGEAEAWVKTFNKTRGRMTSTAYSRLFPEGLMPTVTTALRIGDGIAGRTLHWTEHRSLTVMELRRAQGIPDHEVYIGTPAQQVTIIGNGVDRRASVPLGLALRKTVEATERAMVEGEDNAPSLPRVSIQQDTIELGDSNEDTAAFDSNTGLPAIKDIRRKPLIIDLEANPFQFRGTIPSTRSAQSSSTAARGGPGNSLKSASEVIHLSQPPFPFRGTLPATITSAQRSSTTNTVGSITNGPLYDKSSLFSISEDQVQEIRSSSRPFDKIRRLLEG